MHTELNAIRTDLREGKDEGRDLRSEVAGVAGDLRSLVRSELELAKAETKEQVGYVVKVATWGGIALAAAIVTLVWVALTATYALSTAFPLWASALIVTVALLVIAGGAGLTAKSRASKISLMPKRTARSVKEDLSWAKQQLKSNSTSNASVTR